ncbi:MAG: c-type cytochrome biogenesis protein CcsB [Proteobacteria bacterium]|nr:c-type cytochrome biogenesis protein CcsB [Pseudomonadota bacterium]
MSAIFYYITVALYFTATIVFIVYLFSHKEKLTLIGQYVLIGGAVSHTVTILARWVATGHAPFTSTHESFIFYSWMLVVVTLVIMFRYSQRVIGAFVTPFALVLLIMASFLPRDIIPLTPVLESYWLPVHVSIAFLGNAFFALAFFLGVMYLIQQKYLKSRKLSGMFYVLPSLDLLDELNYRCLQLGFTLLTLAIITGSIWSEYALADWMSDKVRVRQVWSFIAWILYAALLHGRLTAGWRGRKAALLSGAAFIVLIGSFLIINLVLGGAHGLTG